MLSNLFRHGKNERVGLLLAALIFGVIAVVQLWRTFAGVSLDLDGHAVPVWLSAIVGIVHSCRQVKRASNTFL
jgi:hypothetical protein